MNILPVGIRLLSSLGICYKQDVGRHICLFELYEYSFVQFSIAWLGILDFQLCYFLVDHCMKWFLLCGLKQKHFCHGHSSRKFDICD